MGRIARLTAVLSGLAALSLAAPSQAVSPALSPMHCRGGPQADLTRPAQHALLWRLAAPVGGPSAAPLGTHQCRWEKAEDAARGGTPYIALYVCCGVPFEAKLVERIRSGAVFTIYGHSLFGPNAPPDHFDVRILKDE